MKAISVSNLKKLLNNKTKDELIHEIVGLFNNIQQVRELYTIAYSNEGESEVLDKYKLIVKNEFFPNRGYGKARLSVAKKSITDYKKISTNTNSIVDIMLYYVDQGVAFTDQYGDIDAPFYESMENMFKNALDLIEKFKLHSQYRERCEDIVGNACEGWGFKDTLTEMFEEKYH